MAKSFLTPIDLNGNEIRNVRVHILASDPGSPTSGQIWYNSTANVLRYYNGSSVIDLTAADTESIQDIVGGMVSSNTETGIAVTYDDPGGKLNFALDDEYIQDMIGTFFADSTTIDFVYTDGSNTITAFSKYVLEPVRVATTGNGVLASAYENGDVIDGITLVTGNRILIKNQSAPAENGIYTVNASGAPTRATDFDASTETLEGALVFVKQGTSNAGTLWALDSTVATLGTDPLDWVNIRTNLAAGISDFTEAAQDAVGGALTDSSRIDFTYNDGANTITADLITDSVDNTFLANMAASTIKGRAAGAGTGDPTDLTAAQVKTILAVAPADITFAATDKLLGRDTASGGPGEEIAVGGGIEFTGSTGIQTSAFTGDVTKTAGGTALTIPNDTVTYAKIQNVTATDRLLGRDTAGAGDIEELTVGGGIEFTGSVGIQRSALTGNVTAPAGSNTTTIASGVIVDSMVSGSAAIAATKLAFTPTGNISSTTVQAAIAELETDLTAVINAAVEGQKWKDPVDAATTGALPNSPTYSAGAGTLTAGSNTTLAAQDGVTLAVGEDLLVKNQASTFQNGIYTLTAAGSGAAPWVLTRRADSNSNTELQDAAVMVEGGTVNTGRVYTQTSAIADLTSATQTWTLTNQNNVYTADGTTITLSGNQFAVTSGGITGTQLAASVAGAGLTGGGGSALAVGAGLGITVNADDIALASSTAGNGLTYTSGVLDVGSGTGISVTANAIAIDTTLVARKVVGALTGGATSEVLTHNLGTRDVEVQIINNSTPWEHVEVDVESTSTNTVTVRSSVNLPASYRWIVVG